MNRLFLTAITGECCLYAMHGIKPRHYNPFSLLRQQVKKVTGQDLPKSHRLCLEFLERIYKDNQMKPDAMLERAFKHLSAKEANEIKNLAKA
jgi:hypothetical protein